MSNSRIALSIAVSAASLAVLAIACDDSSPPSSFDDGPADTSTPDTGSFSTDSGSSDGNVAVSCSPALPDGFTPTWIAPTKSSACSSAQLGEYYDLCLADIGEEDAGAACEAWEAANTACTSCIAPSNNSGPIQWHEGSGYSFYTLNVAGCLALERAETAPNQCPAAYAGAIQCQRDACAACLAEPNATFEDFQSCQATSKGAVCSELGAKVTEVCGPTYNAPGGGAYDCFRPSGEDARTHFVRVEGIFCGP